MFLAADGVDWSTPQLVEEIAAGLGRPARLWPLPVAWLRALGALAGRSAEVARLVGSLQVDIAKNRELLGWTPPRAARPALLETVRVLAAVSDDA